MDWRFVRLGRRALIVLAVGVTAYVIQLLRSPGGEVSDSFGTALLMSIAISATTLVLIAVRAIVLLAFLPMRRRAERPKWPSYIAGYICGWVGILSGVGCLMLAELIGSWLERQDVEFIHVPIAFGLLFLVLVGMLLISIGWAFGGLGPAPIDKTEKRPLDA